MLLEFHYARMMQRGAVVINQYIHGGQHTESPYLQTVKEPRNRFPAWQNRFLGSLNVYKYGLSMYTSGNHVIGLVLESDSNP
jgi:hypothetical protein